jgi:hypothetical protein
VQDRLQMARHLHSLPGGEIKQSRVRFRKACHARNLTMRITFELIGGPLNGIYSGELTQSSTVLTWYHASEHGAVGREFTVELATQSAEPQQHLYRVTSRAEHDHLIRIAAAYEE